MTSKVAGGPNWDQLYELASAQQGHFTTAQAAEAGYSPQLLAKYLASGRFRRIRRRIYRLVHFPAGEHEDLVVLWLWSDRKGVFSDETALSLHELSDALPEKVHLTLPTSWRARRLRLPVGVVVHYADIAENERVYLHDIPVTNAERTLRDCVEAHVAPDLIRQGLAQALARGLFARAAARAIARGFERAQRVSG